MIINEVYTGAGAGNEIWMAVVTRCLAKKLGFEYGILHPERFKARDFIDFDFGKPVIPVNNIDAGFSDILPDGIEHYYRENLIRNEFGVDITPLDENLYKIQDNTKIDGHFQAMGYIEEYKEDIQGWLKFKNNDFQKEYSDDDVCIVSIRGGDYVNSPTNSLLPLDYYINAMNHMLEINKNMRFYIVSDDIDVAQRYSISIGDMIGSLLDDKQDVHNAPHHRGGNIETDYKLLYNAKNVIMSNSSFAFWPVWTSKKVKNVVSPSRWLAHNLDGEFWSTADMRVKEWTYIDKNGVVS
jgi:hypothetical protein